VVETEATNSKFDTTTKPSMRKARRLRAGSHGRKNQGVWSGPKIPAIEEATKRPDGARAWAQCELYRYWRARPMCLGTPEKEHEAATTVTPNDVFDAVGTQYLVYSEKAIVSQPESRVES
jgi:hypothetical protein